MSKDELLKFLIAEEELKQLAELEKKNDKLGTDLCNAENIVSDLQSQLAGKDREIERLKQDYDEVWEDTYFSVKEDFELNNNCNECRRYYEEELNKQLAEKEKEIESLKTDWNKHCDYLGECIVKYDDEDVNGIYSEILSKVNEIRKYDYKYNQTKISFAVEQLEKAKDKIKKLPCAMTLTTSAFEQIYKTDATRQIDNQIKQLKGEK